jgi:ubiquinone/menaquinone biosynthesis C-methylase UbiE
MIPRLESLSERYSVRFQDQSVVERYHLRPAYPQETFAILNQLVVDEPRVVLDVGCGTGSIARHLVKHAERIDAVDISLPMLEQARKLPEGDSSRINWLYGRAEDVETKPPYALITAGESLHWMDWEVVLPRFASLLSPQGVLAVVDITHEPALPWQGGYVQIVKRFSNSPNYVPINLIAELEKYSLFQILGKRKTAPVVVTQTIEDYVAAQHARSALSLETMTSEQAALFDAEMYDLLSSYAQDGMLTFTVSGVITWGKPLSGVQK